MKEFSRRLETRYASVQTKSAIYRILKVHSMERNQKGEYLMMFSFIVTKEQSHLEIRPPCKLLISL